MGKKPPVSLTVLATGSGDVQVTNIDFGGGMLKDTRLEREGRGHRLVIHGQFEFEAFIANFSKQCEEYFVRQARLNAPVVTITEVAEETASSVAGSGGSDVEEAQTPVVPAAEETDTIETEGRTDGAEFAGEDDK